NNTNDTVDISGWKLNALNSTGSITNRSTVPAGTTMLARRHYLFVNNASGGYSGAITGDRNYSTGIGDDRALELRKQDDTLMDSVGLNPNSPIKEGTTLSPMTVNSDQSYERRIGGVEGSRQDTNDNSADFQVISPSAPQNHNSEPTPGIATSASVDFGS